jgi:uncharacterized SAM-binding protein YcdF (DUF218 family)
MDFFYIISKIFTFFLSPAIWILILLIWRSFAKLRAIKKRLAIAATIIFIFFSNEAIYTNLVNAWQPKPVTLKGKQYEAGIVLGGIVAFDKRKNGFFGESADRFYQACKLYRAGIIKKILVSGGTVAKELPEEADFLKTEMIAAGVKPGDIITETFSKTTRENALFSKRIIDSLHIKPPYVLITSAQHIPRASRLFANAGLSIVPYPCAYSVIDGPLTLDDYLLPKIAVLDTWQRFIKELVGFVIYNVFKKP